jgi:hypothetical protein
MVVIGQLIQFDIKPANVLLDHAWSTAKISDVGTIYLPRLQHALKQRLYKTNGHPVSVNKFKGTAKEMSFTASS